jgi:signal transduction histidine kinase
MAHAYQVMQQEQTGLATELVKKERLSTLGQLTATVAHEMRNPLSAIRNSLHALRELTQGSGLPLDRAMARIDRSIDRCDGIIGDLLEYARARELARHEVTLDPWLSDVLDEQRLPDEIRLERCFAAPAAVIALDGDRFRRVVINLIENAAQALVESGDRSADRRIRVATSAGEMAEIVIEDSGPGIPTAILPRIFEPLFSTKSFGTGLGLPTVKQIVEQHGGTITLANATTGGASARIRLPLAQAA